MPGRFAQLLLLFCFVLVILFLNKPEALFAYIVLYFAGILKRNILRRAELHQKAGYNVMPFIDLFRDLASLVRQRNIAVVVHMDIAVLTQVFHVDRNGRL